MSKPIKKAWQVCHLGICDVIDAPTAGKAKAALIREQGDLWPFVWTEMIVNRRTCYDGLTRERARRALTAFTGDPDSCTFATPDPAE